MRCRLVLLSILLAGLAPLSAHAENKPQFACPYLSDKSKQTLDQMEQGADGWFFRLARDLNKNIFITPETQEYFRRLATAFKHRGTTLVMVPVPPRSVMNQGYLWKGDPIQAKFDADATLENYQSAVKMLNDAGVLTPDFFAKDHSVLSMPSDEHFNFKRDHHWTPFGARFSAEAVGNLLKKDPGYAAIPKYNYETQHVGDGQHKPKMAQELQRLCTDTLPPEPYPIFQTQMKENKAAGADALFGDNGGGSPVVLVGSSFSAMTEFNFEGFLLQNIGIEIANWALAGGMQFNAITSYTSSKGFEKEKPPYVVWEVPYLMDINDSTPTFMRQIIPATYGVCTGGNLLGEQRFNVTNGKTTGKMTIDPGKKISGNDYYIFVESSNVGLTKFTLELDYDDADGEWFSIDRSEHFDKNGRFFVELNDEITGHLSSLSFEGFNNINADIDVKLCRAPETEKAPPPAATAKKS